MTGQSTLPSEGERIATLETQMTAVTGSLDGIHRELSAMHGEMRNALAGRPTWAVSCIITILTACCTGLGAALVAVVTTR